MLDFTAGMIDFILFKCMYIIIMNYTNYDIKEERSLYTINPNANPGFNNLPLWMIHKAEVIEFLRKVSSTTLYHVQFNSKHSNYDNLKFMLCYCCWLQNTYSFTLQSTSSSGLYLFS